jgi:hypothetical protein
MSEQPRQRSLSFVASASAEAVARATANGELSELLAGHSPRPQPPAPDEADPQTWHDYADELEQHTAEVQSQAGPAPRVDQGARETDAPITRDQLANMTASQVVQAMSEGQLARRVAALFSGVHS